MTFLRRIFGSVTPSYLIRSYVIGLLMLGLVIAVLVFAQSESGNIGSISFIAAYFVLCTLVFPFAKLTWDGLRDLAFGNNVIFMNAIIVLVFKFIINYFLWAFAIFVAPFGIAYLWFRNPRADGSLVD